LAANPDRLWCSLRALRALSAAVFLVLPGTCLATAQQQAKAFVASGIGRASVPIDQAWRFHPGDNPAWSSPDLDDSSWSPIATGRPWEGQGFPNLTGFGWYRCRIVLPSNLAPGWELAISVSGVEDAAEVYWNGRRAGSFGKVPPDPVWYGARSTRGYPAEVVALGRAADQPREGVLAIRVWKAPYAYLSTPDMGGLEETPLLGNADALVALRTAAHFAWVRGESYTFALALVSSLVSLLALLAWVRDRRQWMLFWLAVYTIRPLALLLAEQLPWANWRTSYGSVGTIYSATDAALWFLLLYLFNLRDHARLIEWTRICAYIAIGCQILEGSEQFFDWTRAPKFFLLADVGLTIPSLLLQIWPIVLVLFALRKRLDTARWMVAIFGMLTDAISNSYSWFDLGNRWTHWTIAKRIEAPLFTIGSSPFTALTLASTLLLISIVYAVWQYEQERNQRQVRLDEEFRNVQELQQLLIPESPPKLSGLSITSAYRPAQEVGGDFFQVIPLPGDSALIILGDVSGKGLHAAMTVALIVGAIRCIVETTSEPAPVLAALNRRLHGRLRNGFATCLVLRLDAGGACTIANAGHPAPFVDGRELQLASALPLGILPEAEYEAAEFQLRPGDRLTLFTDGLLEARNGAGELFGFARVAELLANPADAGRIADAAQRFGQDDDITILTMCLTPVSVAART